MTKPEEQEQKLELGHDYDGIVELDNELPRWWLGIFWVTILFAVFYVPYYHWLRPDKLPQAAYDKAMAEAAEARAAASPPPVDVATAAAGLQARYQAGGWRESAQADFTTFCVPCHAADGGGTIGPNFTDDYTIHGGKIADFIQVITEGVPEKGMVSWKPVLKPEQIEHLAFYIRSLRGTIPAAPKDPEGKLVDENGEFIEE